MSLPVEAVERIKKVQERDELLAFGFVRSHALTQIPLEIIQICIAFFLCIDEWDITTKGKWLELSGKYNQICKCMNPDDDPGDNYQTILGTLSVSSGKHHWKFKLINTDLKKEAYVRICLGIIKINKMSLEDLDVLKDT